MTRLPVRIRVTLAFAAAMAVLLAGLSAFLILRLEVQLNRAIDDGLRSRAADLAVVQSQTQGGAGGLGPDEDSSLSQRISPSGRLIGDARAPLLSAAQLAQARRRPLLINTDVGREHTPLRVFATKTEAGVVVVAAQSLEARDEALAQLESQLLIGVPIALIIASLAGYFAAAAALRPVASMTRRARAITASTPGARLPLPTADDEIAHLGSTLNAMLGRLEDALAHERGFVADASHELRTPLAIISAEIHVALQTAQTTDEFREALRSLASENDRVVRLAEDLLVLARADQQRLPMRPETVDLGAVVGACAARFAARAAQASVRLDTTAQDDLFVVADELRLDQLLDNLCDNAVRYAVSQVTLTAVRDDAAVLLCVCDDGPGFAPEFVDRAFQRFAVADESRTDGHPGLGLAIVHAVAEAHGWSVTIRANERPGASVVLRAPLAFSHLG